MNNHHTLNDLLDQWVKNEITFDELALLSGKTNLADLQANMDMHRVAVHAIQKHSTAIQIASIHQKFMERRKAPHQIREGSAKVIGIQRNRLVVRIAAAAAIFAALLVAAQMLFVSSNSIYSESFKEYSVNNERSVVYNPDNKLGQLFREGDYKGVVATFGTLKKVENKELFLAGYSSLLLGDFDDAKINLKAILENASANKSNNLFKDEAEYYLTLTYVKTGNYNEAYQLMEKMSADAEHTYHDAFNKWTMIRMKWLK